MRIISASVDLSQMFLAALFATMAAPLGVLGWIVYAGAGDAPGHDDSFWVAMLVLLVAWIISALTTLFIGLPFALVLRRFDALGWLPLCAFGTVVGALMFSGVGAIFGLATSTMFCVGCRPSTSQEPV